MPVKCQTIINLIEEFAPKKLAEDWDNVGLQIGDPVREVSKVLITLDVTMDVVNEAIAGGFELIISHHPLIFSPLKNIRFDLPLGKMISLLMENKIMVYAAHTNLDSADLGVNEVLAGKMGLVDTEVLAASYKDELVKIVVFVPVGYQDSVRQAMTSTGAGWIGNYSDCTFQTAGKGSFKALPGANPFNGKVGELVTADEIRLETITPKNMLSRIIKAMLKAHPYEEVAYDLHPLLNQGKVSGLGRIGYLKEPVSFKQLIEKVKQELNIDYVHVGGNLDREIKKLALCGGSGASLIQKAVFAGADAFLTGDIKYHEAQDALALGLSFIDAGHYATEQHIVPVLAEYVQKKSQELNLNIEIVTAQNNKNPFVTL